jgi:23S rRNA (adenine2503-C2)-methyltransferase
MSKKIALLSLNIEELKDHLIKTHFKGFLAKQIMDWVYKKNVSNFYLMPNISKENQKRLDDLFVIDVIFDAIAIPSEESAVKFVGKLSDGKSIECVVLKQEGYNTLCVSSQVGCPVDCKFCLTGVAGFTRNLKAEEIVGQILFSNQHGHPIRNLVFMGMGEPLLNYDALKKSVDILTAAWGFDIGKRKLTISTSGFTKTIQKLIDDEWYVNLAFSVGCADPLKRERIMPVEKQNPIIEVSRLIHKYQSLHNRQLTLEYTFLEGINDTEADLKALINLAKYLNAKVNLINLNPHKHIPFSPISSAKQQWAYGFIQDSGVYVTVRYRKGQDIAAACGQLGESILAEKGLL